jgi:hypothetical protein
MSGSHMGAAFLCLDLLSRPETRPLAVTIIDLTRTSRHANGLLINAVGLLAISHDSQIFRLIPAHG